jgi:membrane protease YdiL (CAAX protease family)
MPTLSRNAILSISITLEAALLLVAAIWMPYANVSLLPKFHFATTAILWGFVFAFASATISILCLTLGKRLPLLNELKTMTDEVLAPIIAQLCPADILLISVVSGFCEEVLFRGIMQAQFGLWITSIIFGLFHDPGLKHKAYVILAALAGLGLGYVYQLTGNLWSCISAHIMHNLISMLLLRYWNKSPTNAM